MSAIAASSRLIETGAPGTASHYNVTGRIKSWGRRGIFLGANFGFVFGAIFVAIPFTSDMLTFGTVGTLLIGTVECAFIAGAFAARAAALYGKGVRGGSTAQFEHILQVGRPSSASLPRDVSLANWPRRLAYPVQANRLRLHQISDGGPSATFSLRDAQARLGTIDAWENGNTGP